MISISNKFQLQALYNDYKQQTGKTIKSCEGKELNGLSPCCWIDLAVALSFEIGERIKLSNSMILLAEPAR